MTAPGSFLLDSRTTSPRKGGVKLIVALPFIVSRRGCCERQNQSGEDDADQLKIRWTHIRTNQFTENPSSNSTPNKDSDLENLVK